MCTEFAWAGRAPEGRGLFGAHLAPDMSSTLATATVACAVSSTSGGAPTSTCVSSTCARRQPRVASCAVRSSGGLQGESGSPGRQGEDRARNSEVEMQAAHVYVRLDRNHESLFVFQM